MNSYKNITDQDLVIMNVGVVKAGETIETELTLESPNLQPVEKKIKSDKKDK